MVTEEDEILHEKDSDKINAVKDLAQIVPDEDKLVVILLGIVFLIFSGSIVLLVLRRELWWFPLIFLITILSIYAFHIINKRSNHPI